MNISPSGRGHLAMLAFSLLVAGAFPLGVRISHFVDPIALTAVRFALAGVVVGVFLGLRPNLKPADFSAPWRYFAMGGVFSIYFVLMFEALKTASSISTAAIFTLTPIMSAVFGRFLLGQVTTRWMVLALTIGGMGAIWVVFRGDLAAMARFDIGKGELIFLIGAAAHAFYTPLVRKLNRGESPVVFTLGTIVAGCLILSVLSFRDLIGTQWATLPPLFWGGLVYLAVCATALSFFMVQFATLHLPSAKVMAYTYLTPTWVILWEIVLGSGFPPPVILAGIAATIVALFMLLKER